MKRAKIIAALVLTVLVIVIVLQNTEPVATKLLFITVIMPRAALLALTTLVGFALGLLACLITTRKKPDPPPPGGP